MIIFKTVTKISADSATSGNVSAGTMGNGTNEGEDITSNLKTISDIPDIIPKKDFPEDIDIRGEVFIQNSDFKKLKD